MSSALQNFVSSVCPIFFSCFKWEDVFGPCYSILAMRESPSSSIIWVCYFSFILFCLFYCPPHAIVKNNDEIAFIHETLLSARACVTHLINMMSSNHDCTFGWIIIFIYEIFQTFRKVESNVNVLNTYNWQYNSLTIFASANVFCA